MTFIRVLQNQAEPRGDPTAYGTDQTDSGRENDDQEYTEAVEGLEETGAGEVGYKTEGYL